MIFSEIEKRDKLVEEKLLRCDDQGDLRVYSYTNWCKIWNDITMNSRGIIFNRKTGEIISRPFPKFFNMDQTAETQERNLPWQDGFRIFQKYDGWLGILYRDGGQYRIATRGSFQSTGALWATEFLKEYDLTGLPDEVTLLFELICPATKIVVDYHNREELVLLAAYNRHTGEEYGWEQVEAWGDKFGFGVADSYDSNHLKYCRLQIESTSGLELEGFVIRFNNGLRVKIKSDDYFRRSKMRSHLTLLTIWENMVCGEVPQEFWDAIDDDYHDALSKITVAMESRYFEIRQEINHQFVSIVDIQDRKEFAIAAQKLSHTPAMFARRDKQEKRVDDYVMKFIRPHNNIIG